MGTHYPLNHWRNRASPARAASGASAGRTPEFEREKGKGRKSRVKRERRRGEESPESRQFRRLIAEEPAYRVRGSMRWDGVELPLVEPVGWFADHLEFDRLVCASGLKEFARRPFPGESPDAGEEDGLLVRELDPGARLRLEYRCRRKAT
jgi:hypothetical protein